MTDYFALLDQPRSPWLDPDELKQAFHAKSLRAHPDARRNDDDSLGAHDSAFSELNEAYHVLHDPKGRIHHFLSLADRAPTSRQTSVPSDIAELFSSVASATQQAEALLEKCESAASPLTRSLLKPEVMKLQRRTDETLQQLSQLYDAATADLRHLSTRDVLQDEDWAELHTLYLRFSYISRWIDELREKQTRLAAS